jgi:hypothetical protein
VAGSARRRQRQRAANDTSWRDCELGVGSKSPGELGVDRGMGARCVVQPRAPRAPFSSPSPALAPVLAPRRPPHAKPPPCRTPEAMCSGFRTGPPPPPRPRRLLLGSASSRALPGSHAPPSFAGCLVIHHTAPPSTTSLQWRAGQPLKVLLLALA